ncbi:hypothetical protein OG455_21350 [Kitasatospora sp. NBC_01287]|uniref:hypothetical protein n=1 Tax=Kitasatospora sp. NBC_01287 TaxID=2903573 RepID=UPI0022557F01|nr:hypothetical protein [Kitasatospora sp. NBC_01287]MCX4748030.1 hypothetical protein [Kitasatospora sp. NBC_01287]
MPDQQHHLDPASDSPEQDAQRRGAGSDKPGRGGILARVKHALPWTSHGHDDDGASWGKVHNAVGAADFALDPAPGVAGQDQREGAPDQEVVTGGGHVQDELPEHDAEPPQRSDAERVVREMPTATAAEFLHERVPVLDRPPLPEDERIAAIAKRMYQPRSGTKRDDQLTCSVEPTEKVMIDLAAAKLELSRSAFLANSGMSVALEVVKTGRPDGFVPLPDRKAVDRLTKDLGTHQRAIDRAGNNLNQLMVEIYRGELPERAMQVLDALHACAAEARLAYQRILPGGRHGA